jgi:predicted Zn-dependent peptidase
MKVKIYDPYAEFEKIVLSNGLTIYFRYLPECPWTQVWFKVHSGAKDGEPGVAHFLEHLIGDNSKEGSESIRKFTESYGGYAKLGTTSYRDTRYGFMLPNNQLKKGLHIFGNMLVNLEITKFIERERNVISREYSMDYPSPISYLREQQVAEIMYQEHWLAKHISVLGSATDIETIQLPQLQSFYDQHYNPSNISVVISGGLSFTKTLEMIQKSPLGLSTKAGLRNPRLPVLSQTWLPTVNYLEYSNKIDYGMTTDESNNYYLNTKVVVPKTVLSGSLWDIAGGMIHKTLFTELRLKREWLYSIHISANLYGGLYSLFIRCPNLLEPASKKIIKVIDTCLSKALTSKRLFDDFKRKELNSIKMRDFVKTQDIIKGSIKDLDEEDRIETIMDYLAEYEAAKLADIQALIEHIAPEKRLSVLYKP